MKEIIKKKGSLSLWRWKDAEGRFIYAVSAHDREPIYGFYSQAVAWEIYRERKERNDD